jgi:YVTN family beta-propeller protein
VISPDDSRLYIAHGDGSKAVSILNTASLTRTDSLLVNQSVTRLAISPDGAQLYLNNTHGNTLLVVNPTTKTTIKTLTVGETGDANVQILDVAITPDGKKLAAAFNRIYFGFDTQGNPVPLFWGGIALFDTATWAKTAEIRAGDLVANMGITPDGLTIYLAGAQSLTDQSTGNLQVFIFDVTTTSILGTIRGLSLPVAFSFGSSKPAIPQIKMPEWFLF